MWRFMYLYECTYSPGALEKILTKSGKKCYKAENFTIVEECNIEKHSKTPRKSKWGISQNFNFLNFKIAKMNSYKTYACSILN